MNEFAEINWTLLLPIILVSLALTAIALIDCIRAQQTNGPKWLWILIILFFNIIGPVLYFVLGRRQQ